jgi:hypothetical protein
VELYLHFLIRIHGVVLKHRDNFTFTVLKKVLLQDKLRMKTKIKIFNLITEGGIKLLGGTGFKECNRILMDKSLG